MDGPTDGDIVGISLWFGNSDWTFEFEVELEFGLEFDVDVDVDGRFLKNSKLETLGET